MGLDVGRIGRGLFTGGLSEVLYQPMEEQKKAQREAADAQRKAEMDARRIAAEQKPMEANATLQTNTTGSVLGNLGLSIEADYTKKKTSALGGTLGATTGLGFGS